MSLTPGSMMAASHGVRIVLCHVAVMRRWRE